MIDDNAMAAKFRECVRLARQVEDRMMRAEGISLAQSRLLEVIKDTPGARWSDIAAALGFSPRTITEAVDALERDGLVTRTPDPADRRAKILTMTRKGVRGLAKGQEARDRVRAACFGVLTTKERDAFFDMLERMRQATASFDEQE